MPLSGKWLVPAMPYASGFFCADARLLRAHLSGALHVCAVGGVDSRACMERCMADGFAAVAVARPLLRDAGWLRRLEARGDDSDDDAHPRRPCAQCGGAMGAEGPPLCHVCYGAEAIVRSAMGERRLRVGEWPL